MSGDAAENAALVAGARILLIARATVAVGVAAVAAFTGGGPGPLVTVALLAGLFSAGQAVTVTRWLHPRLRWPRLFVVLAIDLAVLLTILALTGSNLLYICYAGSFAAFSGLVLGAPAALIWAAEILQAYAVGRALHDVTPLLLIIVASGVAGALLRSALTANARRVAAELAAAHREATALERARLARELHDSVAKTVRGMSLAATALPRSMGHQPGLAMQLADAITTAAVAAERETRQLLAGLRVDNPAEDLRRTLARLCDAWSTNSGISVEHHLPPIEPPGPVRYELVRILQEALSNVDRHARARHVSVLLDHDENWVWLAVQDDGIGFDVPEDLSSLQERNHHGLIGMIERAHSVGGRLNVVARPGDGTTITVRLPA